MAQTFLTVGFCQIIFVFCGDQKLILIPSQFGISCCSPEWVLAVTHPGKLQMYHCPDLNITFVLDGIMLREPYMPIGPLNLVSPVYSVSWNNLNGCFLAARWQSVFEFRFLAINPVSRILFNYKVLGKMTAINEWAHIQSDNYWCLCKIPLDTSLLLEQETTIPHQKQTKSMSIHQ